MISLADTATYGTDDPLCIDTECGFHIYVCKSENVHEAAYTLLEKAYRALYGEDDLPEIGRTSKGKPYFISRSDVFFSIAHSTPYAAVIFAPFPVGLDIEKLRPYSERIAKRYLNGFIDLSCDDMKTPYSFIRAWTQLESYVKMTGEGIANGVKNIDLSGVEFFEYCGIDGYILTAAYRK